MTRTPLTLARACLLALSVPFMNGCDREELAREIRWLGESLRPRRHVQHGSQLTESQGSHRYFCPRCSRLLPSHEVRWLDRFHFSPAGPFNEGNAFGAENDKRPFCPTCSCLVARR